MTQKEARFVKAVWAYYDASGRHHLAWRKTQNPYRILVSEIMLQQTQVDRVVPKYQQFLKQFPTLKALANASLGEVLRAWQGLGYNRRAQMLHHCAKEVVKTYEGKLPKERKSLEALPGIGPYTAGAIMAFAWNKPVVFVETNIRSVYLHHFFKNKALVPDSHIETYLGRTLDTQNPREWYYALMDYGVYLKKLHKNPGKRSKHHVTQKPFKGSDREVRGAIVRALSTKTMRYTELLTLPFPKKKIETQLQRLESEGLIKKKKRDTQNVYTLP